MNGRRRQAAHLTGGVGSLRRVRGPGAARSTGRNRASPAIESTTGPVPLACSHQSIAWRRSARLAACLGLALALSLPHGGNGGAAAASTTSASTFPAGLYYSQPSLQGPGGTIQLLEGTLPVPVEFHGIGFDVSADFVISAGPEDETLVLHRADGTVQRIPVPGLFAMARPSLSPDGKRVAVQATETPITPGTGPQFLTIYIVDLATGGFTRLVPLSANPAAGNEAPEWFPSGDRIAHQGVEGFCLVAKVYDVATAALLLTIRRDGTTGCYQPLNGVQDGNRFHLTVSRDSSKLLIVGQMQIYDARTGTLLTDLHQSVLNGLAAAGYQPDPRFPDQHGGGNFPMDGTFSTDGNSIVFDGAVEQNGTFGVLLMRINVDGSGFTILRGPITVDPRFSNSHNFSQLNPVFLGPETPTGPLVAAVLPSSRSVQVGVPATAFATIINAGSSTATGCAISPITLIPATFSYQATDPATNQPIGSPNTPVDIEASAAQSFVIAVTPTGPIAPIDVQLSFNCANTNPASVNSGLNTLLFSASATPIPDIVALAATIGNTGIVTLASAGAFAVATVNLGAPGLITVTADTGTATLPVDINLCETNPATGQCISAIGPSVTTQINANATPTFAIFVIGTGNVPLDPAANRISVRFKDGDGVTRGSTGVAVRTL